MTDYPDGTRAVLIPAVDTERPLLIECDGGLWHIMGTAQVVIEFGDWTFLPLPEARKAAAYQKALVKLRRAAAILSNHDKDQNTSRGQGDWQRLHGAIDFADAALSGEGVGG